MNTRNCIQLLIALAMMLSLTTALAAAQNTDSQPVIYLGKIAVHGERNIVRVLQAIKVGLLQPYSTDPKLQKVVVCRLENVAGSHFEQTLVCATNRTLTARRNAIQTAIVAEGDPGNNIMCESEACYEKLSEDINIAIESSPDDILHAKVNGPGFRGLLNKIPYPEWYRKAATPPPIAAAKTGDAKYH